ADLERVDQFLDVSGNAVALAKHDYQALRAVAYDAATRYEFEPTGLTRHMRGLMTFDPDAGSSVDVERLVYALTSSDLPKRRWVHALSRSLDVNFRDPLSSRDSVLGLAGSPNDETTWDDV